MTPVEDPGSLSETAVMEVEGVALAMIRDWVRALLTDVAEDDVEDCLLVVTELVSNAFDHAEKPRCLRIAQGTDLIRIEVDDSTHGLLVVGHSRLGEHRGRGLVMVGNLAAAWGVERHERGKTVWAHVVITGRETSAESGLTVPPCG
ncbi:ATP-binding protein [Actinosynnema sp. NPDC020468]|uniref:ATP-binding protein n=1 Tax=Actinosynnema sp. NPDC020468 TaxID=3154488 RepID=UPI0034038EAB